MPLGGALPAEHRGRHLTTRRTVGLLAALVAVGMVAVGFFAPAGQATQSPSINFTPTLQNFGVVAVGGSSSATLKLTNTGSSATAIQSLTVSGSSAFTITTTNCTSLGPNKSCTVTITYRPTMRDGDIATLTALSNKPGITATATLVGGFTSFAQTACSGMNCMLQTGSDATGGSTSVTATGSNSSSGTLQAGVATGSLACSGYGPNDLNLDPNTYTVVTSSAGYSKFVLIEFHAPNNAPKIDTGDNNNSGPGLDDTPPDWDDVTFAEQVCFQAAPGHTFTPRGGGAQVNEGLLPECPFPFIPAQASGPCVDRSDSKLTNVGANGTTNYDIVIAVYVPAGTAGDPRWH
jgi:hypothetical protein